MRNLFCAVLPAVCFLAVLMLAGGCGGEPPKVAVRFESSPSGAAVYSGDRKINVTPFEVAMPPGYSCLLRFEAPGRRTVWRSYTSPQSGSDRCFVELPPMTASVLIASEPSGADVVFEGLKVGATPLVIADLESGDYTAEVSKGGRAPVNVVWSIRDSRPQRVVAKLSSTLGKLIVNTEPAGALILIDGREIGVSGYEGDLEEGNYTLRLEKEGFGAFEQKISISRGETTRVNVDMKQPPGALKIISNPSGASVFIDGERKGETPLTLPDMAPGSYQLELTLPGYSMAALPVTVRSGETTEKFAELEAATGGVILEILPEGVEVFFDGEFVGVSAGESFLLDGLDSGIHILELRHEEADPPLQLFEIEVRRGVAERARFELWVPDVELVMQNGDVWAGRLVPGDDGTRPSVEFEPTSGAMIAIPRDKIREIRKIR